MARLSHKELAAGIVDGSITEVKRVDADRLLRALGFKDATKELQKGIKTSHPNHRTLYRHRDIATNLSITREQILPKDVLGRMRLAVTEVLEKNPAALDRFERGVDVVEDWATTVQRGAAERDATVPLP